MRSSGKSRLPALACAGAFVLCELISRPWAEMGVADDWSYVRSAQILAQTGHIAYNGWAAAIVGWQLYLGAAFIKLFGFSFTAARLSTMLIAVISAYLMQRTMVEFGIGEGNAVIGTLTFVLSPLFMQLSGTMMTDVPGFFSMLACIYGCIRALKTDQDRSSIAWLCFAILLNAVCGTSRQIAWLGVLVVVPSTLWLLRSRRAVFLYGLAATTIGCLFVLFTLHWFSVQPYAWPEPISLPALRLDAWKMVASNYVKAFRLAGLLLFPLSVPFIAAVCHRPKARTVAGMAALSLGFVTFLYWIGGIRELHSLYYPFISDWVGPHALYESMRMLSSPPTVFGPIALHLISGLALVSILCVADILIVVRPRSIGSPSKATLSRRQLAIFFGPLTFAYMLLLSRRGINGIFDRYLFLPLFIVVACVLLYSQRHLEARWSTCTYAAVAAMAAYGVITTHNTFAFDRARVVLAQEIFATGVPPNYVDLGWEMNAWYELQVSDHINQSGIVGPTGTVQVVSDPHLPGCRPQPFGTYLHLAPRYGVGFDPNLCDGPAPFAPVQYLTWPLLHPTSLYVVRYPPPWRPAIDYVVPAPDAAH